MEKIQKDATRELENMRTDVKRAAVEAGMDVVRDLGAMKTRSVPRLVTVVSVNNC